MGKETSESLFVMDDFRTYIRAWARARGRGELSKIAEKLKIHTTLVSQIMSHRKCLTEEQASRLCAYMGLNPLETDYFLKLVQLERAGTESLKSIYLRHLKSLRGQAQEAKSRVPESKALTEQDRAIFYSSWQYSMVRLLTSMERFQTVEDISLRLGLTVSRVREILDFLTSRGLCVLASNGRYKRTEKNTHVEASSPLAIRHHQNWRNKVIQLQECMTSDDLSFTAPVSISRKDISKIRSILLDAISESAKIVDSSPAEEIVYLGIDWLRM